MENIRTLLAMVGLVALGFVGGFLAHSQLTKKHLEEVIHETTVAGFHEHLLKTIQANKEQQEILSRTIHDHAYRLEHLQMQLHHTRMAIMDSLRQELYPSLSNEQKELLERYIQRHTIHRDRHHHGEHH